MATVMGSFEQVHSSLSGPLPLQLWKTTVTIPAAATSLSIEPSNKCSGTVVGVWIDPTTLTGAATIKGYAQNDDLTTPDYFCNYTVPATAVESRALLYSNVRVHGKLQVDIASATAADVFVLYVWVDANAASSTNASSSALGSAYGTRQSKARPAGTTAYEAGDCVGTATNATAAYTFPIAPAGGGEIMITSAALEIDLAAVPSGMTTFKLHLYNVTPPSALGDGVAWDLPAGDRASYLGSITFSAPADIGSTLLSQSDGVNLQVTAASANLFGYLVTTGGYTPSASDVAVVKLHSIRL